MNRSLSIIIYNINQGFNRGIYIIAFNICPISGERDYYLRQNPDGRKKHMKKDPGVCHLSCESMSYPGKLVYLYYMCLDIYIYNYIHIYVYLYNWTSKTEKQFMGLHHFWRLFHMLTIAGYVTRSFLSNWQQYWHVPRYISICFTLFSHNFLEGNSPKKLHQ